MPDKLTPRQREVLDFIRDHIREVDRPPTHRETAAHFGWATDTGIRCHLVALERKGLIRRDGRASRGIRLVHPADPSVDCPAEHVVRIPLVGSVPAGLPMESVPESDETLALPMSVFHAPRDLFALRVRGDSMTGAGILDGDRLIVRRVDDATPGQIVVASIDGETTVKRYLVRRRKPVLHAENPAYPDILPKPGQEWRIEGLAVGLARDF